MNSLLSRIAARTGLSFPMAADDAPWKEDQHKRDKTGKFTSGGGGGGASSKGGKSSEFSTVHAMKNKAMGKIATTAGYHETGPLEWTHPKTGAKITAKPGGYFKVAHPGGKVTEGKSAGFLAEVLKQPGFQAVAEQNAKTSPMEEGKKALSNAGWTVDKGYANNAVWTKAELTMSLSDEGGWELYSGSMSKINGGTDTSSLSKTLKNMEVGGAKAIEDPKSLEHPEKAIHKAITDHGFTPWSGNTPGGVTKIMYEKEDGTEVWVSQDGLEKWDYYLPGQTQPITGDGMDSLKGALAGGEKNEATIGPPQGFGKQVEESSTSAAYFPGHGVDTSSVKYKMKTGEEIFASPTTGAWIIYEPNKDYKETHGEGQAALNSAFNELHPRDASGKFIGKPNEPMPAQDISLVSTELESLGALYDGTHGGTLMKYKDKNGNSILVSMDKGMWVYQGSSASAATGYNMNELLTKVKEEHSAAPAAELDDTPETSGLHPGVEKFAPGSGSQAMAQKLVMNGFEPEYMDDADAGVDGINLYGDDGVVFISAQGTWEIIKEGESVQTGEHLADLSEAMAEHMPHSMEQIEGGLPAVSPEVKANDHAYAVVNNKLNALGYSKVEEGAKWYISKGPNGEMLAVTLATNKDGNFDWIFDKNPTSPQNTSVEGYGLSEMADAVLNGAVKTAAPKKEVTPKAYQEFMKTAGFENSGVPGVWMTPTGDIITVKTGGHWNMSFMGQGSYGVLFKSGQGFESFQNALTAASKKPEVNIGSPMTLDQMKKVGEKLGSNEGGTYEDDAGNKYYVKMGKTVDHARNEITAVALAQAAGMNTLQYAPIIDGDRMGTATRWEKLQVDNISGLNVTQKTAAQHDFAIHAWLANWDAAGIDGANIGVVNDKVTGLDFGGSLLYRAQGGPKGAAFNADATEWDTLRDKHKNPKGHQLYGSMTQQQLAQSAARLKGITDAQIKDIVAAHGPGDVQARQEMAVLLMKRRDAIVAKGEAAAKAAAASPGSSQGASAAEATPSGFKPTPKNNISKWSSYPEYQKRIQNAHPPANSKEEAAITKYTGGSFEPWNKALRGSFGKESGGYPTKDLMAYLARADWPEDGAIVKRQVSGAFAEYLIDEAEGGHVFVDHGFASADNWHGTLTMHITLPKGAQAVAVGHYSQHPVPENEILIQAGSKFRIDSYDPKTNEMRVTLIRSGPAKGGKWHIDKSTLT